MVESPQLYEDVKSLIANFMKTYNTVDVHLAYEKENHRSLV